MKRTRVRLICCTLLLVFGVRAQAQNAPASALESVLHRMDATAAMFKTAEADFTWQIYQRVVEETDTQKGHIYFRRNSKEIEMAAHITEPEAEEKQVLYRDSKLRVYQPRIDQVTEYNTGKNRAVVESFLVLGFGGRGHELLKSFDVTLLGYEEVGGVRAAKLQLIPKTQKGRNVFERILLWIDPARGISVQQQFFEPGGNYRLAQYGNIKVNESLPGDVFKLKTTSRTKVVNPQGGF